MKPLYSVGEEVILCSKSCPEMNGDYIVVDLEFDEAFSYRKAKSAELSPYDTYTYKLNGAKDRWFMEESLRKKHTPGDNFTTLMDSLKDTEKA